MARLQTRPKEQSPNSGWLPDDGSAGRSVPADESSEPADRLSGDAGTEVEKATEDAPATVATAPEKAASPLGTPAELEVEVEAITARFDQAITGEQERFERELDHRHQELAARSAAEVSEVRSDVQALQTEVGDIRARLSAAAEKTAERRKRSAQEVEKLAADLREEMAEARDRFEALMSHSDELRKAQETFNRRQRKVLGAFAKRLERVEAGTSSLKADAGSTHALLAVLSQRHGAAAEPEARSGELNLNTATFEDLRGLGFSATQATRVLTYRDAHGFDSVERIMDLPGMPDELLRSLKARLTV